MYLLKKLFLISFLFFIGFSSCKSGGPLTPEEAFYKLKYYVKSSKIDDFIVLLSTASIDKINKTKELFSMMPDEQIKVLSGHYGISEKDIKNLTVEGYVNIYFLHGKKNDIITRAINSEILSVNVVEKRAKITMENGHFLFFVKEGPYWKFEMGEL